MSLTPEDTTGQSQDQPEERGFSDEERADFGALVESGFIDTFREFTQGNGHYSWWSFRANARARNVGWRIDYFLISESLRPRLVSAGIPR